jgi:hypothetical protein
VEQGNDGSLEFGSTLGSNGNWGETLPQDNFANVGGNEKRDSTSKTVTLLQKLIEEDNHDTGEGQLGDDERSVDDSQFVDWSVHSGEQVGDGLSEGDDDTEHFLSGLEKLSVLS